jgi:hypothetical protein
MYSIETVLVPATLLLLSLPIFGSLVYYNKRWRQNYLFVIFYLCCLPITIVNMSAHMMNYLENGSSFCVDNAVAYSAEDSSLLMCLWQSVILVYFQWATFLSFTAINVELATLLSVGKTFHSIWKIVVGLIFGVPLVQVAIMIGSQSQGYEPPYDSCTNLDTQVNFVPMATLGGLCALSLLVIYVSIGYRLWTSEDRIKVLCSKILFSIPTLFCTIATVSYIVLICLKGRMNKTVESVKDNGELDLHIACIFKYFNGNDDSWTAICGEGLPSLAFAGRYRRFLLFFYNSQHFFIIVSLVPMLWKSVWKKSLGHAQHARHVAMDAKNNVEASVDELDGNLPQKDIIRVKHAALIPTLPKKLIFPVSSGYDDDSMYAVSSSASDVSGTAPSTPSM